MRRVEQLAISALQRWRVPWSAAWMGISKAAMRKLSADIEKHDKKRREARLGGEDEAKLNAGEKKFAALADSKGKDTYRSGWPDFFVVDRASGGAIGVEVKESWDTLSKSQIVMFAALEAAGTMEVMIFEPHRPGRLKPWRVYLRETAAPADATVDPVRTPVLPRMKRRLERGEDGAPPPSEEKDGALTVPIETVIAHLKKS